MTGAVFFWRVRARRREEAEARSRRPRSPVPWTRAARPAPQPLRCRRPNHPAPGTPRSQRFRHSPRGYVTSAMGTVSELRLPADREHILVASERRRVRIASRFDMDAIDDLTIAVAQACENAIRCLEGPGRSGQVRIVFKMSDTGLEVTVRSRSTGTPSSGLGPSSRARGGGRSRRRHRPGAPPHGALRRRQHISGRRANWKPARPA